MWMFSFFSEFITHIIFIAGVITAFFSLMSGIIPGFRQYRMPLILVSGAFLLVGSYLQGSLANEKKWEARVKQLEADIAKAEAKSQEVVTKVVTQYVTRTQVVKERGEEIIKYVEREVIKYDNKCEIPTIVIRAHDAAAKNQPLPVEITPVPVPDSVTTESKNEPVIQTNQFNAAARNIRLPKREEAK